MSRLRSIALLALTTLAAGSLAAGDQGVRTRPPAGAAVDTRPATAGEPTAARLAARVFRAGEPASTGSGGSFESFWGTRFRPLTPRRALIDPQQGSGQFADAMETLRHWNQFSIDSSGLDHTEVAPGENRVFGEQYGPTRASRAIAIVHIAVFDAVNAIAGRYKSYTGIPPAPPGTSMKAAIAQAAHDTLVAMFPSQRPRCTAQLVSDLSHIPNGPAKTQGILVGRQAAAAILALRANDGSQRPDPRLGIEYITSNAPGRWRQDPIGKGPTALGGYWGQVRPFVLTSGDQFRVPPPPPLDSPEYAAAFDEVTALGGDGVITSTVRTQEETEIGIYWAYDGTPSLCAPTRLYNQMTMHIADQMGVTDVVELTRLLALVNTALADAGIASWESKFFYDFWRPVTAVREADPGTGPTGAGDGNPSTAADPTFTPLGAPASNLAGPNFSPPFPAYPSGHATFGGTLFQMFRRYFRTDDVAFTFVSDEFNGETRDNEGDVRPLLPRSFDSFSDAEEENGQSRIYLGIHWAFDKTEGIAQGRQIADYVFEHAFTPLRRGVGTPD